MEMNMLRKVSRLAVALVSVATVATALASARGGRLAAVNASAVPTLEGVWDVTVSVLNPSCQPGDVSRTVRATNMFMRGGTLIEEPERANLVPRSPSFGAWHHVGDHQYTAVFRFPRFNSVPVIAPDGSFTFPFRDTQKVSRTIILNQDGSAFTATAVVEHFDATGNLLDTGCATEAATRLD